MKGKMKMTANEYLNQLLEDYKLSDDEKEEIKTKRDEVKEKLESHFGSKIVKIKYSGSISKKTAISSSKDIDIAVHFKKDAFDTLEKMYDSVYEFLEGEYDNPRKQNVSIGLEDENVDVVPGRRLDEDTSNNDVKLYRRDTGTSLKTNLETHKNHIKESGCRKIIRLMKIWKYRNDLKFKSFALELLVIKALDGFEGTSLKDKTKKVLEYIEENIETVELIDPANSSNNVSDSIKSINKKRMKLKAKSCLAYLDGIESGDETELSAWKKVYNDDTTEDTTNESKFSLSGIAKRDTADWGAQPPRRHG